MTFTPLGDAGLKNPPISFDSSKIDPSTIPAPKIIPPVSQTMDAGAIAKNQTAPGIPFPQNPPDVATYASNANSANTSIANPIPSAESIINTGAAVTPAETKQKSILDRIAGLVGGGKGQSTLTNEAETAAGVPALTKTVNDLSTQLQGLNDQAVGLQNEANSTIPNQVQLDNKGSGVTKASTQARTADALRLNQIKQGAVATQALTVKAALYGAQGNLTLAKDAADKAATAQYEQQQKEIDYQKAQLDALTPTLNKEEKAQAAIQTAQLADRQKKIDNAKEDKKSIIGWAITVMSNNPTDPAAHYAAQQALAESNQPEPDLNKAMGLIGKYMADPNAAAQAVADLQYKRAQTANIQAETKLKNAQALEPNGGKPPTATQTTYANYAPRLETADKVINNLTPNLTKLSTVGFLVQKKLPSYLRSADIQSYQQAEDNFINAVLRQESGAAVPDSERVKYEEQYFPQPGDSQQVIAQKAQNRTQVVASYKTAAGPAYAPPIGEPTAGGKTGTLPDGTKVTQNADGSITDAKGNKYDENGNKIK